MPALRVYLDANVFITAVEATDEISDAVWRLLESFPDGDGITFHTSELTLAEVLVQPLRDNDRQRESDYRNLIMDNETILTRPVDREVLVRAASLRASARQLDQRRLILPDFVHAATALGADCGWVLTADRRFPALAGVRIEVPTVNAIEQLIARSHE
jgi:predicted nucleic acid-binding protein